MQKNNENQKQLNIGETLVNKKYTLIHKLYESQNSKIFVGAFMKNGKQESRIIKVQQTYTQSTMNYMKKVTIIGIRNQINLLRHLFMNDHGKLQSKTGFPQMFQYGTERNHNYIVTALYGPNLAQLMKLCGGRFSARTTLLIALQIIDRIQDIHNKRYLYGGMSPQNFVIGTNKQSYLIYMINFSKSIVYKSKSKDVHIPYQHKEKGNINGNDTFISINQQLGVKAARRDDIQAFMYLILFMFKGKLPWMHGDSGINQKLPASLGEGIRQNKQATSNRNSTINNINNTSEQNRVNTLQIKRRLPPQALFKNLSFQMIDLMHYVKTLSFYERPDYIYIRKKLWNALMETDYQQLRNNIILYDWNQRQSLDYQIYRDIPLFKLKIDQKQKNSITQNNYNQHKSELRASDKGSANEIDRNSGKKISQKQALSNSKQKPIPKRTSTNSNLTIKSSQKSKECKKIASSDGLSKKIRKVQITQQDDANVIDDDFVNENQIAEKNQLKIEQKLKITHQIDVLNLNQPLHKDTKSPQIKKSRFKSLENQRKCSQAQKFL